MLLTRQAILSHSSVNASCLWTKCNLPYFSEQRRKGPATWPLFPNSIGTTHCKWGLRVSNSSSFKPDFHPVIAFLDAPIKISYVFAVSGAFVSVLIVRITGWAKNGLRLVSLIQYRLRRQIRRMSVHNHNITSCGTSGMILIFGLTSLSSFILFYFRGGR